MRFKRRKTLVYTTIVIFFSIILLVKYWRQKFAGVAPVPGWENSSRNLRDYINENVRPHILPTNFCKEVKILLVMVSSAPGNFELREAVRETWGRKHDEVGFYFITGETGDNRTLQHLLEIESNAYDDIIQERFLDTYNNLTLKSVNMLKLFTNYCEHTHQFLMKVNDDTYVNIPRLLRTLIPMSNEYDLLLGKVAHQDAPYRDYDSKWYMPYHWYPNDTYPDFVCGVGYVMSTDVAQKLYLCALETPLLHCEDVFLTGVCAKIMNISPTHSNQFTCNRRFKYFNLCNYDNIITFHPCTAADIRDTNQFGYDGVCSTIEEFKFKVLMQWIFFFNIP